MSEETQLIIPRRKRRNACFKRYRANQEPKPKKPHKKRKPRKTKPKRVEPKVIVPKIKRDRTLQISLTDECFQSLALVRNKSRFIEKAILGEMKRIYARHGREWVDWPSERPIVE